MGESSKRILRMNFLVLLTAFAAAANALDVQKILTPKNGEVAALSCKNGKANLAKDTEVDLTITTNKYCKEQYGWGISKNMICAMGPESGGKDSCQGDSGGPLVVKENGHHAVVGVVSWGAGCAEPETPGVYARVTAQMSWILENTSGTLSSTCAALN